ncbi:TetR family transcriptional regulator C-terminal domain-containing protein [Patulibacter sp. SYSU D01012]|uniref:TetR/AcrR family transcriptional regulator n=1 Tax=Patulibacter sp. SYSU D01012 TaxID=2817381 RepID=UPI001B30DD9A
MPKVVDHEERRRLVAEAVWRIARTDGLEAASVRNVAAEAGLSPGAMRHYFDGQADLQRSAMETLLARVQERVAALDTEGPPVEATARILLELLPLDDERQAEAEIWFAFTAGARRDPGLRALADGAADEMRAFVAGIVGVLLGPDAPADAVETETARLHALVDGLALHAVQRPGAVPPARMRAAVERHLAELAGRA